MTMLLCPNAAIQTQNVCTRGAWGYAYHQTASVFVLICTHNHILMVSKTIVGRMRGAKKVTRETQKWVRLRGEWAGVRRESSLLVVEAEEQGSWGGFRKYLERERGLKTQRWMFLPVVFAHSDSESKAVAAWKVSPVFKNVLYHMCGRVVSLNPIHFQPSASPFPFPLRAQYSLKASRWKASHRSQHNPS